ncbi:cytochrome P450 [Xylariaceae sp. FL0016]|nr:cytochrome P450 [Xylariaceae sp. FL0016]
MMLNTIILSLGLILVLSWIGILYPELRLKAKLYAHRHELPPGPKTIKTGIRKPWLWFQELSAQYGDVVYLQMGPTPTIVLGSAQAAWDLLERRGAIYSSRPRFIMGGELLSNGMRGLMASYGPFWRRWRKLLHSGFMQKQSESYRRIQSLESKVLMQDLLDTPERFRMHLERYAASVIVMVTYGRRVDDVGNDTVVQLNNEAMGRLTSVNIPGKYAVERYPILKYVPSSLAPWKAEMIRQRQKDIDLYTGLMNDVKERMAHQNVPPCFATHVLQEQHKLDMTDLEVAYTAGSPFGAGVETSAGSLASFFLACVSFGASFIPRAQEELDRVVGRNRLPAFGDMPDLEYIRAIASETLRWRPVAVLGGTPHASTADDVYKGMFIPKGSTIIAPLWTLHLNETDFPNPHEFRPERFLGDRKYPGNLGHSAFGWGRRVCPGMYLGSASVLLNIARVLWAFDVEPAKDPGGQNIGIDIFAFSEGFNSSPLPFPCSIKPRSEEHAKVVREEYRNAMGQIVDMVSPEKP